MFISTDVIYFIVTVFCGILYGFFCYRSGLRTGSENTIDYFQDLNYITIDEETGEINRVNDRQYKK